MSDWTPGSPEHTGEDRHVWLRLHDQSGYPFAAVGWLYTKFGPGFERWQTEWKAWMKGGQQGERPEECEQIPWLRVASLGADNRLSHWHNIEEHMALPKPGVER